MDFVDLIEPHAIAAAIGLLLGFERERHRGPDGQAAVVGSRTFTIVALAGSIVVRFGEIATAAGLLVVGALLIAMYLTDPGDDRGLTTEAAMVAAYLLGALTWTEPRLAVALGVGVAVLLASKHRLHHLADVATDDEVDEGLKFLVAAFVALPLLPSDPIGPGDAVDLRSVWRIVVLIVGIGWVANVATRLLGRGRGIVVTGLAGGFVSGAATTGAMGRIARSTGSAGRDAALAGAWMASVSTMVQLVVIVGATEAEELMPTMLVALAVAAVTLGLTALAVGGWRPTAHDGDRDDEDGGADDGDGDGDGDDRHGEEDGDGPVADADDLGLGAAFSFGPAILLAGLLTAVVMAAAWATDRFGSGAAVLTAGLAGFADAHGPSAAAATLATSGRLSTAEALVAIGAALATNTVSKLVIAGAAGGWRFAARFAIGMLVPIAATATVFVVAAS